MSVGHTTPAEEGAQIKEPEVPSILSVNRAEFEARMAAANRQSRETATVVESHISTLLLRINRASDAMAMGHLGSAAAYLQIATRDLDAALAALPKI